MILFFSQKNTPNNTNLFWQHLKKSWEFFLQIREIFLRKHENILGYLQILAH